MCSDSGLGQISEYFSTMSPLIPSCTLYCRLSCHTSPSPSVMKHRVVILFTEMMSFVFLKKLGETCHFLFLPFSSLDQY